MPAAPAWVVPRCGTQVVTTNGHEVANQRGTQHLNPRARSAHTNGCEATNPQGASAPIYCLDIIAEFWQQLV